MSLATYLQWTAIGPSWPNCSLVLCTWPMKSMKPSPDLGTPCSGQSVNWNWRTVLDWPSWRSPEVMKGKPHEFMSVLKCVVMCRLFKELFVVMTEEWDSAKQYPFFPTNDHCYLILDQWLWLTSSCNVTTSAIVSHSKGNYIFSFLLSLSHSHLTEINRASCRCGVSAG